MFCCVCFELCMKQLCANPTIAMVQLNYLYCCSHGKRVAVMQRYMQYVLYTFTICVSKYLFSKSPWQLRSPEVFEMCWVLSLSLSLSVALSCNYFYHISYLFSSSSFFYIFFLCIIASFCIFCPKFCIYTPYLQGFFFSLAPHALGLWTNR